MSNTRHLTLACWAQGREGPDGGIREDEGGLFGGSPCWDAPRLVLIPL
jgi:hypothetical protein